MKQEIISILVCLGVIGFVGCFITGAVLTLLAQEFDDEISWDEWEEDDWRD